MGFHSEGLVRDLTDLARNLRIQVIEMIYCAQSGHPGGSLSAADIVAALYFHHLRLDPMRPDWPERDRFILSKGHAAPLLYAALCERGFFGQECLITLRCLDSPLQGHPDRLKTDGVEMTAGSLGHGLSVGVGLALGACLDGAAYHTYVLLGDGEIQAGIIWEAAMTAAKYGLGNLTAILDYNDVQLDGPVHEIMPLEPVKAKWESFGWHTVEIDGHNMRQILEALDEATHIHARPTIIIAHTVKGKGVSFMENKSIWHGRAPTEEEYKIAMAELRGEANG
jgi:transketolase